ncbi:hypothetical protein Rs2_19107 [Raphanus sativus]|nr:hypothetical protein Rs2_19107 [Raphanus sativus]
MRDTRHLVKPSSPFSFHRRKPRETLENCTTSHRATPRPCINAANTSSSLLCPKRASIEAMSRSPPEPESTTYENRLQSVGERTSMNLRSHPTEPNLTIGTLRKSHPIRRIENTKKPAA